MRLAVTADMMALGSHFLENASPYTVGRKALAVNLSDLAAAGSEPKAFFLSISLPRIDENWLEGFPEVFWKKLGALTVRFEAETRLSLLPSPDNLPTPQSLLPPWASCLPAKD